MLGDLGRDEHSRFPVLKIIDFGLASNDAENAVEENISAIGTVCANISQCSMLWLFEDTLMELSLTVTTQF